MSKIVLTADSEIILDSVNTPIVMRVMQLAGPPGPPGPTGVAGNPYTILDYTPIVDGVQQVVLDFIPVNVFIYIDGLLQSKTGNYTVADNVLTFLAEFNILTADPILIVYN